MSRHTRCLQSKGSLGLINSHQSVSQEINDRTNWSDLKTIRYSDFGKIAIPKSAKPRHGRSNVARRQQSELGTAIRDEINDEHVRTILGNDDYLNTVMLTATTRGEANLVEHRLKGQRRLPPGTINAYQVDVEKKAEHCVSHIVGKLMNYGCLPRPDHTVRLTLRDAHKRNWRKFATACAG
ncbi:uncharacterized protein Z519_12222 [Cladophialophora bantiana CBS 173.52]|uniref:Uncharacterized protein n=1 Tax=Cladophialophora bantiana (strain ATCC 10958 / CBS 173.52 / CDC B-1940 / NIH 8579) TaxID=1442370 RepID=A0A0D2EAH4_CLAB1|nr:uncharacterized protein Z519_12222 [Cladophialophora bantiana CBS 173.52]KIW87111.1 hypothetical protein Z519_12222 [Cladophialophora bantiana CBS 173.52]